jgi:hypothetical protein
MGFRCRWIATRGRDKADVLARLKLVVTGEIEDEIYDTGLYAFDIAQWFVVFGDGWDYMDLVSRRDAARLSAKGEALYLYTDDTPMCAELTAFVDGQVKWSIIYDGGTGPSRPTIEGPIPSEAKRLLAAAEKAQKGERDVDHVYDVIAELGHALVGFRHDQTPGAAKYLPVYELRAPS